MVSGGGAGLWPAHGRSVPSGAERSGRGSRLRSRSAQPCTRRRPGALRAGLDDAAIGRFHTTQVQAQGVYAASSRKIVADARVLLVFGEGWRADARRAGCMWCPIRPRESLSQNVARATENVLCTSPAGLWTGHLRARAAKRSPLRRAGRPRRVRCAPARCLLPARCTAAPCLLVGVEATATTGPAETTHLLRRTRDPTGRAGQRRGVGSRCPYYRRLRK